MFSNQLSLKTLSQLCRSLSTLLHSGVPILKAFQVAGEKVADPRARAALVQIRDSLKSGNDVAESMRATGGVFPELMIEMINVAEQTGSLPEVLHSLSGHYENNLRLRRDFQSAISWPAFQFFAAIFVIAGLLYLLGIIAQTSGNQPLDVLGMGLTGGKGAAIWLTLTLGSLLLAYIGYQILNRGFAGKKFLDPLLMRIPVLGTCMRSFAVARFSWSFALTQQSGMTIGPSLDASFRATANGAFTRVMHEAIDDVISGDSLTEALTGTRVFPSDWIEMVHIAETTGTVPEMLQRMGPQFEDQARRSLKALASAMGWVIWGLVALFIVFLVFRIAFWYIGLLQDALKGI